MAVPLQIYSLTGSSAYVGLAGVFGLVPLLVFGLWGGAIADAVDKRLLLGITTAGLIGTALLFWVQALAGGDVWVLLGLFALQQAFFAVNQPTRSALLPQILPADLLASAQALGFTVMMAGAIVGPLMAGVLIPIIGYAWLYFLDAVTLLATAYAVIRLPALPPVGGVRGAAGWRQVAEGLHYLRTQPVLMMSFVVDLIAMIFGMPRALFPEIAAESFDGPSEGGLVSALLFAAIPVGAVLGGVFSGWVSRISRQGLAVVACVLVWGVAIVGFGICIALAPQAPVPLLIGALAFLALGGAADVASAAFRSAILLNAADESVRGRLQGVFTVVVAGGPRVADVAHGASAAAVGTAAAATGGGVLVIVGTVIAALVVPSFVRYRVTAAATAPRTA